MIPPRQGARTPLTIGVERGFVEASRPCSIPEGAAHVGPEAGGTEATCTRRAWRRSAAQPSTRHVDGDGDPAHAPRARLAANLTIAGLTIAGAAAKGTDVAPGRRIRLRFRWLAPDVRIRVLAAAISGHPVLAFDHVLEDLEILLDRVVIDAQSGPGLLDEIFGLPVELHGHA